MNNSFRYYKNLEKENQALKRAHLLRENKVTDMRRKTAAREASNLKKKDELEQKDKL